MRSRFRTLQEIVLSASEAVRPPERMTVSQAAEKYRKLNNPGSYVGMWKNDTTPYLTEPMDEMTSLDFTGLIFVGPARTGKSDMFFNYLGYTTICDPADMMVVHMTQATARDWSQGDLDKALRHSPAMGKTVVPGRQNRNVHDVRFLSGMRLLVKWPTITELSGKTIPRLWLMDYDRMDQDIAKQGNPFDLTKKRAQTFRRFGMCVAEASPGFPVDNPQWIPKSKHEAPPTKGILSLYNRGDRRRWHWKCPGCLESFEPDFDLFSYPDLPDHMEAAEQVVMVCPHNGCIITPDMKDDLNSAGRWIKEGQTWNPDGTITGTARRSDIASFWMKGPAAAFQDWKSLVYSYLQAEEEFAQTGEETALFKTVTTDQGNAYTPKASLADRLPEELKNRATDWGGTASEPVVPQGVRFLVATVDVQARAFVVQVQGFGVGGDVWIVDMFKIRKSERLDDEGERHVLDPAGYGEDWNTLIDQVMLKAYPLGDGSGRFMSIKMTGCDSGGKAGVTSNAYAFWRHLRKEHPDLSKRFRLVKGVVSNTLPIVSETTPDAARKDRFSMARGDEPVVLLNSDKLKDKAAAMLNRTDPGGGQVSFPHWAQDFLYIQLTNEIRTAKGWENPRKKRNEAWDLLYYALGLSIFSPIRMQHWDWSKPPSWAADWDNNDLVFGGFVTPDKPVPKKRLSLADLGESLA